MSDEPSIEKLGETIPEPAETIPESVETIPDPTDSDSEKNITIKKSTYSNMIKGIVVAVAIATFLGGYSIGTMQIQDSGLTSDDIQDIIDTYVAEQRQVIPQPAAQPTQPTAPQTIQVSIDDDPIKGNPDAPVTVIEFSDFQCPFCSRFYEQTLPLIQQNYIDTGKIKFVYRDMPLDGLHPNARTAHIASECADEQGKFWDYHDILFERQGQWQSLGPAALEEQLKEYATELGAQESDFESCLSSPSMADEVAKDLADSFQYGASGTPTFFIGNEENGYVKLVGAQPFASFKASIDSLLN